MSPRVRVSPRTGRSEILALISSSVRDHSGRPHPYRRRLPACCRAAARLPTPRCPLPAPGSRLPTAYTPISAAIRPARTAPTSSAWSASVRSA